jgi:hypothetical protein
MQIQNAVKDGKKDVNAECGKREKEEKIVKYRMP